MSDLVGNPEDQFSGIAAHIFLPERNVPDMGMINLGSKTICHCSVPIKLHLVHFQHKYL